MQLIMGIGSAEEIALAEIKAEEQLKATKVEGHDEDLVRGRGRGRDEVPDHGPRRQPAAHRHRPDRLDRGVVGPAAGRAAHRAARSRATPSSASRATTASGASRRSVMDENKQAMIEADEFDAETMMVMFRELRAKQIRAEAEGRTRSRPRCAASSRKRRPRGMTRCPIRDIEEQMGKCPVDIAKVVARRRQEGGRAVHAAGDGRGRSRHGRRQEGLVTDARPASALLAAEQPSGRRVPAPRRRLEPDQALQPALQPLLHLRGAVRDGRVGADHGRVPPRHRRARGREPVADADPERRRAARARRPRGDRLARLAAAARPWWSGTNGTHAHRAARRDAEARRRLGRRRERRLARRGDPRPLPRRRARARAHEGGARRACASTASTSWSRRRRRRRTPPRSRAPRVGGRRGRRLLQPLFPRADRPRRRPPGPAARADRDAARASWPRPRAATAAR